MYAQKPPRMEKGGVCGGMGGGGGGGWGGDVGCSSLCSMKEGRRILPHPGGHKPPKAALSNDYMDMGRYRLSRRLMGVNCGRGTYYGFVRDAEAVHL